MSRTKKDVSISDVARKAGVSIATVSRVLNSNSNVIEETRAKVNAAMEELNYTKTAVRRLKPCNRDKLILVSIPALGHKLYNNLLLGIYNCMNHLDYFPVISHSLKDKECEQKIYRMAIENNFSGAILISPKVEAEDIALLSKHMPVVQCFDYIPVTGVSAIKIDDEQAAYDATNYLIEKGHRRIALITSVERTTSSHNREIGYKRALTNADIPYNPSLLFESPYDFDLNREHVRDILSHSEEFDAVLCTGDYIAYRVLKEAEDMGISVPNELSVMGFDDIKEYTMFKPELTTVFQDAYSIGYYAASSILNQSIPDDKRSAIISNIEYRIIERESVSRRE